MTQSLSSRTSQDDGATDKTVGIACIVLAVLVPIAGLIVSLLVKSRSEAAGRPNALARAGVFIGAALTLLVLTSLLGWGALALMFVAPA